MDIKSPKVFETSDKAHADLFNEMVKVLLENDYGLLDQIIGHIDDTKPHASEAEKKKWNESQLYKITADDGKYLISVPADKNIYDAIKDKGTCTFIASPGVEDSPAPSNAYLRGIQTVGQDKIGTGFAVDTSGNAYYFYYNSSHISITWTQLPTAAEKSKWNSGQLSKITADNGTPSIYVRDVNDSILDKIIDKGLGMGTFYAVSNSKDLPEAARSIRGIYHITDTTNGKGSFGWVYATDFENVTFHNYLNNGSWRGWQRVLTEEDKISQSEKDKWNNGQLYQLTQDSGTRKFITDGSDLLTLPPGFYYGINNRLLNNPDPSDAGWFNYDISDSGSGRKMIVATASFNNTMWFGTVHTNGDFKGWKRVLTDDDLSSTWNQVTLIKGTAAHNAVYPLKFSIRQNVLYLRGSFESIPPSETVIARFAQKPTEKATFGATTVGSYGSARLSLTKDGSLKFDGLSANDPSKVNRIEINESIPLW
ncbi:hypothetical protein [Bacillus altitudinis]|uniref:hypothetical protein n=1 Tax=Bacillus altitudinis TaxID=293387 RepID=UPI001F1A4A73|nr:hypothetical protein [Bacillus altitudinis]